jgi:hypothetical protein
VNRNPCSAAHRPWWAQNNRGKIQACREFSTAD